MRKAILGVLAFAGVWAVMVAMQEYVVHFEDDHWIMMWGGIALVLADMAEGWVRK